MARSNHIFMSKKAAVLEMEKIQVVDKLTQVMERKSGMRPEERLQLAKDTEIHNLRKEITTLNTLLPMIWETESPSEKKFLKNALALPWVAEQAKRAEKRFEKTFQVSRPIALPEDFYFEY